MLARRFLIAPIVISAMLTVTSCTDDGTYPADVVSALEAAGSNAPQLRDVLRHYAQDPDTLKYEAALFLIGNMEGHAYGTYRLVDTLDQDIAFDIDDYANFDALLAAVDSIESESGELDFKKGEKVLDVETITSEFLIEHIDYAFRAWRDRPWAKFLTFDQFCQYVLPYRGSNEPMERWRPYYWGKYNDVIGTIADSTDPAAAAVVINTDVRSWFGFDQRYYFHPTDQGHAEMLESGLGRCEDMTNVTIYALRANGLAVTSDYTPYWANTSGNHAWNAILLPSGEVVPFMGAEADPGSYSISHGLGKAYRKMYAEQKNNLIFQERKQEEVPAWLRGKNYLDVTSDYVETCDVTVHFDEPVPDSVDIAYLCVFNSGNWEAIHWGRIEGDSAVFTDMGREVAYLPALYLNEEIVPFGPPIILDGDCSQRSLVADDKWKSRIELIATTHDQIDASTVGRAISHLTVGTVYELFYFADGDWQSLGKATASDTPLEFEFVPGGALYWLVAEGSRRDERIFTIEDGVQTWW